MKVTWQTALLKRWKGAWLIERRVTLTVGPSSLSTSRESAVGGAYRTETGRGKMLGDCQLGVRRYPVTFALGSGN